MMDTATEAPTPALPPKAPLPAIWSSSVALSADTTTLPSLRTTAALPISLTVLVVKV